MVIMSLQANSYHNCLKYGGAVCEDTVPVIVHKDICILFADQGREN